MASTFVDISKEEMESFLNQQGFVDLKMQDVSEIVYAKRVDNNGMKLSLRIYSGIEKYSGHSRGIGEDAIRLMLFYKNSNGEIVKLNGSNRVNRTTNWKINLKKRIDNFCEMLPQHICKNCNAPMILRKGAYGNFHGCCNYPNCKFTIKENDK